MFTVSSKGTHCMKKQFTNGTKRGSIALSSLVTKRNLLVLYGFMLTKQIISNFYGNKWFHIH